MKSTPKQPKLPATNECAEKRSNCHPAGSFCRMVLLFPQRLRERQFPCCALESVSELLFCVRARLQPCRNRRDVSAASAAEGMNCQFSHSLFSWAPLRWPSPSFFAVILLALRRCPRQRRREARHKLAHRGSGGKTRRAKLERRRCDTSLVRIIGRIGSRSA
jgi:hypothetical protein